MSYTPEQMNEAVSALVDKIGGLHSDVARAWATAEQGANHNILGVTYTDKNGQHLYTYPSFAAGAQGAANLINGSSYYAGIRHALANGNSAAQAAAIIASPWNHPYYSSGKGAAKLREIAAGHTTEPLPTGGSVVRMHVHGETPVFDRPGGKVVDKAYNLTQTAERYLIDGRWWYHVTSNDFRGRWMPAEPTMTILS